MTRPWHNAGVLLFWKQPEQLVKTTSSFSPRSRAAILKPGAVAPGCQELFLSVVMVVSCSTKLILINGNSPIHSP